MDDNGDLYISDYDSGGNSRIQIAEFDRTAPTISITQFSGNSTFDTTPDITGTVTDDLTVVTSIEFSVDSGTYTACTADDGVIDENSETFTCAITSPLTFGSHSISVRSTDNSSNTNSSGTLANYSFIVASPSTPAPAPGSGFGDDNPEWTPTPNPSPDAYPIITRSEVTQDSVTLFFNSWGGQFTHYILEYGLGSDTWEYGVNPIGNTDSRSFLINSLAPDTNYYFRITPVNVSTVGTSSPVFAARTLPVDIKFEDEIPPTVIEVEDPIDILPDFDITVIVQNLSQELLQDLTVTLTNYSDSYSDVTDNQGHAVFGDVKGGAYDVKFENQDGNTANQAMFVPDATTNNIFTYTLSDPAFNRSPAPVINEISIFDKKSETPLEKEWGIPEGVGEIAAISTTVTAGSIAAYLTASAAASAFSAYLLIIKTLNNIYLATSRSRFRYVADLTKAVSNWIGNTTAISFFAWTKINIHRKGKSGIVFDLELEKPLMGAFVTYFSKSGNLSTSFSSVDGTYNINPKPDEYEVNAHKEGYQLFREKYSGSLYSNVYRSGETIVISSSSKSKIDKSIALVPDNVKHSEFIQRSFIIFKKIILGFTIITAVYSLYDQPTPVSALVVLVAGIYFGIGLICRSLFSK